MKKNDTKKFELIVVDMDGILSNFRKGISKLFDININKLNEWNLYKKVGIESKIFWNKIANEKDFWINLEKFPHADELMIMVEKYADEIIICSHPPGDYKGYGFKKQWLEMHNFGRFRHFIGNASKGWLACYNRVLIDDYIENIRSFEEKGGIGIIFPHEYNLKYINDLKEIPENRVAYIESKIKSI